MRRPRRVGIDPERVGPVPPRIAAISRDNFESERGRAGRRRPAPRLAISRTADFLSVFARIHTARHVHCAGLPALVMSDMAEGEARAVADEIVRYLRAHPGAADTLDGAARWWLHHQPRHDVMERAMAMLVDQKIVERHVLLEGTTVFRMRPLSDPSATN